MCTGENISSMWSGWPNGEIVRVTLSLLKGKAAPGEHPLPPFSDHLMSTSSRDIAAGGCLSGGAEAPNAGKPPGMVILFLKNFSREQSNGLPTLLDPLPGYREYPLPGTKIGRSGRTGRSYRRIRIFFPRGLISFNSAGCVKRSLHPFLQPRSKGRRLPDLPDIVLQPGRVSIDE